MSIRKVKAGTSMMGHATRQRLDPMLTTLLPTYAS